MKKLYKIVAVVAIVAAAGVTAYNAQTDESQMSSLAMKNVEALAHDEFYSEKIFYQNCAPCKTRDGGYNGVTFYCSVGIESCFSSTCIAGSCGGMR